MLSEVLADGFTCLHLKPLSRRRSSSSSYSAQLGAGEHEPARLKNPQGLFRHRDHDAGFRDHLKKTRGSEDFKRDESNGDNMPTTGKGTRT